jgi:PBP1b-binding outer membrane lipoprotein LpoB
MNNKELRIMKKLILVTLIMIISVSAFGCSNKEVGQEISKEQYKRKFIIIDSVNEPLPPEAENVEYMPSDISGPQLIPNAKFSDPIIITKMPNLEMKSEKNTSNVQK